MTILKNLRKRDYLFLFFAIGLTIGQVWLELTIPEYSKSLSTAVSAQAIDVGKVWEYGGMMLLCAFGAMAFTILCGVFTSLVAADFARNVRAKLFDTITEFSNADYDRFSTASLITRTTNDVVHVQNFLAMGTHLLLAAPITAIWALCKITAANISWTLAVISVVAVLVFVIIILIILTFPRFRKIQALTDDLNRKMRESISGVRVVRAFNAESFQNDKFGVTNNEITANNLFTYRALGILMPIMTLAMYGLTVAIYWIGAYIVSEAATPVEKATELGNMVAFASYGLQIVMAFVMLVAIFIILPRTIVSVKRINEVLHTKPSVVFASENIKTDRVGEVEFKGVGFSYHGETSPVLKARYTSK